MSSGAGKTVCVTGASGYIASWLVKQLLLSGYTVKASVRDPNDPRKTQHLLGLEGAESRLKLFKADLLEQGSFDSVVEDCVGAFHTASPVYHRVLNPQAELLDPAVKGTLNVLSSCAKTPSVKRVVLTSSIATVAYNGKPRTPDVVVDENWFSDPDYCKGLKLWYTVSKTMAEDSAWKFSKEKGIDMVAINPAMVIGPLLQPTLNTSAAAILKLIKGAETFPNATFGWVNVKDVATAHIQAFEIPSASGRYCLVERVVHHSEIVKILHHLYPSLQLPQKGRKMSSGVGKTVCVTGASGFIASWLVKQLLLRGYTVKASVRDPNDPRKTQHLLGLEGAESRLKLFKADLLEQGSFDSVVEGCVGVFHTASPFYHDVLDPEAELLDPAVKGTLNVLSSCAKTPSVKRVVLTSSIAAVAYNGKPRTPDVVVDENWFSDPDYCKGLKLWYTVSKTMAEDSAWKFSKEKGIDMVAINPAMVIGPLLQPTLNTSAAAILNLIKGAETFPNATFGWVNVKDVATAHIQAFEIPSASGRYCLVERVVHYSEIVNILHHLYPSLHLPQKCAGDKPYVPTYQVSKEKAKSLGIEFIPLDVSLKETVESLKEKGFVHLSSLY
ncbi:cinnamoyl-CoA reductase 1 [Gossypium australe]|uniref:Cinnamoyl-CoA reductase 1 n=1 Tax=Gossypium australe TaxID=47621 RepID=A0A5B6ULH9_9ROSI|nr:cinnamoyl-CoA reductase 1 [Gossypium australe]